MLQNYLKIAIRNLSRNKWYSLINIVGLSTGMAACFLILLFVRDELKYDQFHEYRDRVYRVATTWTRPNGSTHSSPIQSYKLAPALQTALPQMEAAVRIYPRHLRLQHNNQDFLEREAAYVDEDFFDVFSFELLDGNQASVLSEPFSAVITEELAKKYFETSNPIGQRLTLKAGDESQFDLKVTGIMASMPEHSHFHFNMLVSMSSGPQVFNERVLNNWGEGSSYTYLMFPEDTEQAAIEAEITAFKNANFPETVVEYVDFFLQPLGDIHLHSQLRGEIEPNGDIFYVYVFTVIALFVILIAAINYMNLATARSARRAREVGMRKVLGAFKKQLVMQFLGESLVLTSLALITAIALSWILLPAFNELAGKTLSLSPLDDLGVLGAIAALTFFIGIFAGSYPAFFLARFQPAQVLKGTASPASAGGWLRKTLVVLQFSISTFLIIATLVILGQIDFLHNKKLGMNPEEVLVIRHPGPDYEAFRNELLKHPDVRQVTASNKRPTRRLSSNLRYQAEGVDPEQRTSIKIVTVDYDFFETLDIDIVKGRSFSKEHGQDATESFILNEAAVAEIGWEDPIGKWFETSTLDAEGRWTPRKGVVVGVARNIHFESLHIPIQPVAFFIEPNWLNWLSIKISGANIPATITHVEQTWQNFVPQYPFDSTFLDADVQALYNNEERFLKIFVNFAVLAIVIASLGIFGLASYMVEQRTREIGIRKTLGASVSNIVLMLTSEFTSLVLLANLIAWPFVYYYMSGWLDSFPYKSALGWEVFVFGAIIAGAIAGLSVSYQALRAGLINPIRALQHE